MWWQAWEVVNGPLGPARNDILAARMSYFSVAPHVKSPPTIDNFLPVWGPEGDDTEIAEEPPMEQLELW